MLLCAHAPVEAVHRQARIGAQVGGQRQDQVVDAGTARLHGDPGAGQGAVGLGQAGQQAFGLCPFPRIQHRGDARGDQRQQFGKGGQQGGLVLGRQGLRGEEGLAGPGGIGVGQDRGQRVQAGPRGGAAAVEPQADVVGIGAGAQPRLSALDQQVEAGPVGMVAQKARVIGKIAVTCAQGVPADQRLAQGACGAGGVTGCHPVLDLGRGQGQRHRARILGPCGQGQGQGQKARHRHVTQKSHHHPVSPSNAPRAIHNLGKFAALG